MIKGLIILVSFFATSQKGCGQMTRPFNCTNCTSKDSVIVQKLAGMNFEKYYGNDVSVFLDDVKFVYVDYVTITKKAGYIDRVMFGYSDSVTVEFRVSNLNQKKPLNFGYTFDVEDFKKKKISMICFRYGGLCIKGCEKEFCPD